MEVTNYEWIRNDFPEQLIDALSVRNISPETFRSILRATSESFVGVVGKSDATAFCLALAGAIKEENDG